MTSAKIPLDIQAFAKELHELIVLAAIREGPRHGYQIALDLEQRSGGLFLLTHGTLYPILHRLEAEGAIVGRWLETGARRRKSYALTAAGRKRLTAGAQRCAEVLREVLMITEEAGGQLSPDAATHRRRA